MTAQPIGEHLSNALIEQIDGFIRLEVDQQGFVPACLRRSATSSTPRTRGGHARYRHWWSRARSAGACPD
jgi:hypothetical protein